MKRGNGWLGSLCLLAAMTAVGNGFAQDIAAFKDGYITFENPDTNRYYRLEFKPNLTGPEDWAAQLPRNIKSSDPVVTVPVGVFYRVAGSYTPFSGDATGNATIGQVLAGATFSTAAGTGLVGTMPNRTGLVAAQDLSSSGTTLWLRPQAGYYPGGINDYVTFTDVNFTAGNIRAGATVFGRSGTVIEATGTAADSHVLAGQTFSRAGAANQTGTMVNRGAVNLFPGTSTLAILAGYHNGGGDVAGDADLVASNIRSGVNIFKINGSVIEATGTAADYDVLAGQTFSRAGVANRTGTMVNRGATNFVPGTTSQAIPVGYHNGSGSVAGDAELVAGNIRSGVNLFNVNGSVIEATGTAADSYVLNGQTFSRAGAANRTGTMVNRGTMTFVPGTSAQAVPQGYHTGSGTVAGDAELVAGNIRSGVSLFGVSGTLAAGGVPKTGQTTLSRTGDDGDLEKGVAWPSPRFTDHGNGTVTDSLTGLMWVKAPHSLSGNSGDKGWNNAIDFCNGLTYAGHSDWRMPNLRELQSLIDYSQKYPALPSGHPFTGVQVDYWSSTTDAYITPAGYELAWYVSLDRGFMSSTYKDYFCYVCPVRAGQ